LLSTISLADFLPLESQKLIAAPREVRPQAMQILHNYQLSQCILNRMLGGDHVAKSVLLVDDSRAIRRVLRSMFEASGSQCTEAENGAEAIEEANACAPDLIVFDVSMPRMSGIEALSLLRELLPSIPIILFSIDDPYVLRSYARIFDIQAVVSKDYPKKLMRTAIQLLGQN